MLGAGQEAPGEFRCVLVGLVQRRGHVELDRVHPGRFREALREARGGLGEQLQDVLVRGSGIGGAKRLGLLRPQQAVQQIAPPVLQGGDGDFERALEAVRSRGKRIIAVAHPEMTARELRNVVGGNYLDIRDLERHIARTDRLPDFGEEPPQLAVARTIVAEVVPAK